MNTQQLRSLLIGTIMITTATGTAHAQSATPMQPADSMQAFEGQTIDEMIGTFMKQHNIPGMTLAIVQAPYIPRVVGYGSADIQHGFLAPPKTLSASPSKTSPASGAPSPSANSWDTAPGSRTTRNSPPSIPRVPTSPTR